MADDVLGTGGVRPDLARSLTDGTLLSALAHDLRGHLGTLGNWLHVLDSGSADTLVRQQAMVGMKGAVAAETRLIEQVQDLSSILRGTLAVSLGEVDLTRLLMDLGAEAVIPATARLIVTDSRRLRQVLGLVFGEGAPGTVLVEELVAERVVIRGRARTGGLGFVGAELGSALADLLGGLLTVAEGPDPTFALELATRVDRRL